MNTVLHKKNTRTKNSKGMYRKYYLIAKINQMENEIRDIDAALDVLKEHFQNLFNNLATRHLLARRNKLDKYLKAYTREYKKYLKCIDDYE